MAKILVVDDEVRVLSVIEKRLESQGYAVVTAQDGNEALKKVRSENPDLIILDLILPGLNGYEVCSFLKRDKRLMKIPVVMLTARSQEADAEMGFKAGADAYMTKPFKHEILLERVKELLEKAEEDKKKDALKKEEEEKKISEKLMEDAKRYGIFKKRVKK